MTISKKILFLFSILIIFNATQLQSMNKLKKKIESQIIEKNNEIKNKKKIINNLNYELATKVNEFEKNGIGLNQFHKTIKLNLEKIKTEKKILEKQSNKIKLKIKMEQTTVKVKLNL